MNNKSESFSIEILDKGYIVHNDNKRRAVESSETIHETMASAFREMIPPLNKVGLRHLRVFISVEENPPQVAKEK